jgi:hypothetical protein
MKRMSIVTVLLVSMVLLGCEGPSANLSSGHGTYGDIRDEINPDYRPSAEEAPVFESFGLPAERFESIALWTPEEVAAFEAALDYLAVRAWAEVSQGDPDSAYGSAMRSLAEDGVGTVSGGGFTIEFQSQVVEPISTRVEEVEVVQPDGRVVIEYHIINEYADEQPEASDE